MLGPSSVSVGRSVGHFGEGPLQVAVAKALPPVIGLQGLIRPSAPRFATLLMQAISRLYRYS